MTESFALALERRLASGRAPAVVGLDPRIEALPTAVLPGAHPAERIAAFLEASLPLLARHVPVVKPNIAFFEAHGWRGYRAYETICHAARAAGLLVIGDIKRGDIGSTAAAYAAGHTPLVDALTLHPYLGSDSIDPFLQACRSSGTGLFVLVRTSNPSAAEFQGLEVGGGGGDLSAAIARAVHRWGEGTGGGDYADVGAVVGATFPEAIAGLRAAMPRAWFLLPGVGAQGASVADVAPAFDARGRGALVAQSRGVMECFAPEDPDWQAKIEAAVQRFAESVLAVAVTVRRDSADAPRRT